MKTSQLLSSAFVTLLLLLAYSGIAPAALVIHGKDPIDTIGTPDGWSGIASFTTPIEAPPEGPSTGMVVSWTYGVGPGRSQGAHVTPLLLERDGGVYSIIGIGETREPARDSVFEEEFSLQEGTDTFDTASGSTYHMAVLQQRDGGDDNAGGVIPFGGGGGGGMFYQNTVGPNHVASVDDVVSDGQQHASGPGGRHYNIQFHIEFGAKSKFQIEVNRLAASDELEFKWESADGKLYNLRSEIDPSAAEPIDWPIFGGHSDLAATPPENTLTIPMPADLTRLFVVEGFPAPPVSVFSDDFEGGQGGWTTGTEGAVGTMWELGLPGVGPAEANSPTSCFGTNLTADYAADADVWLRSPPIDLTNTGGATLNYVEWRDIEAAFDSGRVVVLDATDNSEIAEIEDSIDGFSNGWENVSRQIPPAALGKVIKIEFRFQSDNIENFPGWYIDDVSVTVP